MKVEVRKVVSLMISESPNSLDYCLEVQDEVIDELRMELNS
jgi:hypothetical protein